MLIDLFGHSGLHTGDDERFKFAGIKASAEQLATLLGKKPDAQRRGHAQGLKTARRQVGVRATTCARSTAIPPRMRCSPRVTTTICWDAADAQDASRRMHGAQPALVRALFAVIIGASVDGKQHARRTASAASPTRT